jgi:hypothetical protein
LKETERNLERITAGKSVPGAKEALADARTRVLHDSIMKTPVADSPVALKLQIVEILGDAGSKKKGKGNDGSTGWEAVPGKIDGIFNAIIVPEFRATKDPRLMDYWEMMLRKNQERIFAGMPSFKEKEITQVERPAMQWARAQDLLLLGLKNRAITEMFNLIKAYPQHPDAAGWITRLEQVLAPAPTPAATILNTGGVPPPTTIPPATSPGNPPTAIIVPAR